MFELSKTDKLIHKWTGVLIKGWHNENIDLAEIRALFRETQQHLEEFSKMELIPKTVSGLIDMIREFEFQVALDEQHSLHNLNVAITDVRVVLTEAFFTDDFENTDVESYINKLRV